MATRPSGVSRVIRGSESDMEGMFTERWVSISLLSREGTKEEIESKAQIKSSPSRVFDLEIKY